MAKLTRAAIFAAQDIKTEIVKVPEWRDETTGADEVCVRGLTGRERDDFEESCYTGRGKDRVADFANLRAKLCALCLVDDNGLRLFTDEDVKALGDKSAGALDRVFGVAQRLSRMSDDDVQELVGNSASAQNGGSTSASPSASA